MSIKLSLKELKDLLKIQNKKLKKRRKNKKKATKGYENNIRSSSAHMISGGTTMMNTANEQGELIRLQRQALEDKLKEDKENKIKKEAKEKEAKEQYDEDIKNGVVPYNRLSGNGGSNKLRDDDLRREVYEISNTLNQYMFDPRMGELVMPTHGPRIPTEQTNAYVQDLTILSSAIILGNGDIGTIDKSALYNFRTLKLIIKFKFVLKLLNSLIT